MNDEFHEIAVKSILFKGRSDAYFCYLKSEKIAHVLVVLLQNSPFKDNSGLDQLLSSSALLPETVVHFVAGELEAASVLADIFSILSQVRLSATQGYISKENAALIASEYENIAKRIAAQDHPSPFVSSKDFSVQEVKLVSETKPLFSTLSPSSMSGALQGNFIKDIDKGHENNRSNGHQKRVSLILDFVRKNKGVSIKDIAAVIHGCSEKTIQRELGNLIQQGLIERRGERRWSIYIVPGSPS